ncbi:kinase-like domain-containing protein [Pilobolus umbonatus]|nr:kinase-like domain-containing protein [Pilobolus umbonatus]
MSHHNKIMTVSAQSLMGYPLHPEFDKKYQLGQELGNGGFGFVMSCRERESGIERAVKFIIRQKVPHSAWLRDPVMGVIPMEIYTLKHVQHPNIIAYFDSYQDEVYFYLVMELHGTQWQNPSQSPIHSPALTQTSQSTLDEDELEDEIMDRMYVRRTSCDLFECIEQFKHFEESVAKKIFRQIVDCVAYLDRMGVCHRDIKDENIVVDNDFKVKLIDFGSSVIIPRRSSKRKLFTRFYGTIPFASPEILLNQPYRAEPAEIWSLGVLLYTLLFGEIPFPESKQAILGNILPSKIRVSNQCTHLIHSLLEKNPDVRMNIHQVRSHPWLQE